ncbi:hypothetical protein ACW4TU_45190 (plasmid) [Streptomyces sp. QTS52]
MSPVDGLRVTVEGALPTEVMTRIADAVRQAVVTEIAEFDIAPPLHEVPLQPSDFGEPAPGSDSDGLIDILLGIWLKQAGE